MPLYDYRCKECHQTTEVRHNVGEPFTGTCPACGGAMARVIGLMKIFAISPEKGAETIVYLASSNEVANTSGLYYYKSKPVEPSKLAQDDAIAERLWDFTDRLLTH